MRTFKEDLEAAREATKPEPGVVLVPEEEFKRVMALAQEFDPRSFKRQEED